MTIWKGPLQTTQSLVHSSQDTLTRHLTNVEVGTQIHQSLSIYAHVVDNLADSGLLSAGVTQHQRLLIDGGNEGSTETHASAEAALEVLVEEHGLADGCKKHGNSNQDATVCGLRVLGIVASDPDHQLLEEHGLSELQNVLQGLEEGCQCKGAAQCLYESTQ